MAIAKIQMYDCSSKVYIKFGYLYIRQCTIYLGHSFSLPHLPPSLLPLSNIQVFEKFQVRRYTYL